MLIRWKEGANFHPRKEGRHPWLLSVLYPSTVGRAPVDQKPKFADILRASIAQHYGGSQGAFARAAKVAESSVSRWLSGVIPSRELIAKIAPFVLDAKANPIPAARLDRIAYPELAPAAGERVTYMDRPAASLHHRLALEIDELLADDGPLASGTRADLETVLDSLLSPYRRRYLRKSPNRKVG